ncbi:MAG: hypothetical protein ACT4ON_07250 [Bacteroidota bacterium]
MKKIIIYLLISTLITACSSSRKLMESGNYDAAIHKAVRKLTKRKKDKEIIVLEQAYKKANERDMERINFLKKEGNPDNWNQLYTIYYNMSHRQNSVKPLLPLLIKSQNRDAVFELRNFDEELIQTKQKAAEFLYARALESLEKKTKFDARKAYNDLQTVKNYYPNYKDLDTQIQKAINMGTSYVIFKMKNNTGVPLPPNFQDELTKISMAELNNNWLKYHVNELKDLDYDYTILVNMKNINVSPEAVKEIHYTESKEVPDGFQYVLDAKGNVKKDTSGNDIKLPKTKLVSCNVLEVYQNKKAIIAGTLDFIDNSNGQLLKTNPIASENFFEFRSATAMGDTNILKAETKAKLGKRPAPFPPDFDMILAAGQTLKGMVKDIIWSHKGIFN